MSGKKIPARGRLADRTIARIMPTKNVDDKGTGTKDAKVVTIEIDIRTDLGWLVASFQSNGDFHLQPYWKAQDPRLPDRVPAGVFIVTGNHDLDQQLFDIDTDRIACSAQALAWYDEAMAEQPWLREAGKSTLSKVQTDFTIENNVVPILWYENGMAVIVEQGGWRYDGPAAGPVLPQSFGHHETVSRERAHAELIRSLIRAFADRYNPLLPDKLFIDGLPTPGRRTNTFARGDEATFRQALQDMMRLCDGIDDWPEKKLWLGAYFGTPETLATCSWMDPHSDVFPPGQGPDPRSQSLCRRIFDMAKPTGWAFHVRGGGRLMRSLFSMRGWQYSPEYLRIAVEKPTATGRLEALERLEKLLAFYEVSEEDMRSLLPD